MSRSSKSMRDGPRCGGAEAVALADHRPRLQLLAVIEIDGARLVRLALDEPVVEVDAGRAALRRRRGSGGVRLARHRVRHGRALGFYLERSLGAGLLASLR